MDCVECEARSSRGAGFAQGMGMAGRRRAGEPDALALANQIPDRRIAFMPQASIPDKEQHNAAFITFV